MAGAEQLVHIWNAWGIQALVLLSFILQVELLILAELRRRMDSSVLRVFVWSAYLLADSTAIYVLGHLSVTTRSPEHQLMAYWAPFLLLHLGGQDNITAYAIEDNQLWLRHLQTLAVQVAAAGYVLYESTILGSWSLLLPATILMFVVGILKYGERVWALKSAGSSPGGGKYRSIERPQILRRYMFREDTFFKDLDTESFLLIAHELLDVPKDLLLEGAVFSTEGIFTDLSGEEAQKVAEMQISLMHDVFYTKAEVMHTWYGLCIRIISSLGMAAAFVLFNLLLLADHHDKLKGYSGLDVAVTYFLLVGGLLLEIMSLLRAIFSSWTWALLRRWSLSKSKLRNVWVSLARVILSIRRLVNAAKWRRRYWSGSLGQHNLLQLCARSRASRLSKLARWMGVEDWWNTLAYSWSIPISAFIEKLIVKQLLLKNARWSPDHVLNVQSREGLKRWGLYKDLNWSVEESILTWHIATDIYLYWYKEEQQKKPTDQQQEDALARGRAELSKTVEVLSNYMLSLLAARPYMLPPSVNRNAYVQMCYALPAFAHAKHPGSAGDLAGTLQNLGNSLNTQSPSVAIVSTSAVIGRGDSTMVITGSQLGAKLIVEDQLLGSCAGDMLDLIVQVWVDMLCYVSSYCSAPSHAKQLSNGGEFTTLVALLMKYITRGMTSDPTDAV